MPLDGLGSTCATVPNPASLAILERDWESSIFGLVGIDFCNQVVNKEFLVSMSHHLMLIASLPFVHTARRFNRLNGPANSHNCSLSYLDCGTRMGVSFTV